MLSKVCGKGLCILFRSSDHGFSSLQAGKSAYCSWNRAAFREPSIRRSFGGSFTGWYEVLTYMHLALLFKKTIRSGPMLRTFLALSLFQSIQGRDLPGKARQNHLKPFPLFNISFPCYRTLSSFDLGTCRSPRSQLCSASSSFFSCSWMGFASYALH